MGFERPRVRVSGFRTRLLLLGRQLSGDVVGPALAGVPLPDMALFYRQMAALVGAGISVGQALANLGPNTRHARLRAAIQEADAHVLRGGRLSDVVAAHPDVFPELHLEMLRAGERAGTLAQMLAHLAEYLEQELELRRLISRLTIYTKLLAVVALLIVGKSFFLSLGGAMPAISALVLSGNPWAYLLETVVFLAEVVVLAGGVWALGRLVLLRSEAAREAYEHVKWALPGIGGCAQRFAFAKFGRAFGLMYRAGMPLSTAIELAGRASGSGIIARAAALAAVECERGGMLSQAFGAAGVFPGLVISMLQTGEQTGSVDETMLKAAEYLSDEAATRAYVNAHMFATGLYLLVALIIGASIVGAWGGYAGR